MLKNSFQMSKGSTAGQWTFDFICIHNVLAAVLWKYTPLAVLQTNDMMRFRTPRGCVEKRHLLIFGGFKVTELRFQHSRQDRSLVEYILEEITLRFSFLLWRDDGIEETYGTKLYHLTSKVSYLQLLLFDCLKIFRLQHKESDAVAL